MGYILLFLLLISGTFSKESNPDADNLDSFNTTIDTGIHYKANSSFTKCFCDPLQGWNGVECVQLDANVIEDIVNRISIGIQGPLDHYLSSVDVSGNACFADEMEYAVTEGSFFLTAFGELYHKDTDMLFTRGQYCLEYIIEPMAASIIQAYLCVPKPKVSVCCQAGGDCNFTSSLPVLFGESIIQWSTFDLVTNDDINCIEGETMKEINLQVNSSLSFHYVAGEVRPLWTSPPPIKEGHYFPINSYCLSQSHPSGNLTSGRFCYFDKAEAHRKKCSSSICIRKCCPENHAYDASQNGCTPQAVKFEWEEQFYDSRTKLSTQMPSDLIVEHDFPWCEPQRPYILDPKRNPGDEFLLLNNGSLFISLSKIAMPPSQYCIDSFADLDQGFSVKAVSCFLETEPPVTEKCLEIHRKLSSVFIIVSCIFLSITLFVYTAVPELHAKLHGKSLLSHVTSLLLAYLCQLIVSSSSSNLTMTGCKIIALFNQVSFLWAFFWLNVMCFDIWWTLKSMRPSPETGENTRRRFALYSAYAWGCPLVVGLITAIMEFHPSTGFILPGFGVRGCWFQDERSTWIYFHGFTLTLYILNIIFFIHVASILIRGQRSTQGILRTTRKQHTERVFLYLRLFAVMGISWICEVVSWQEGTCEAWIFPDIVNSCQGIFIFFIFMCNRKVLEKVKAKWLPILQRIKTLVRRPSLLAPKERPLGASSSQRTNQTSVGSSSRRLSSSSLQPCDTMQFPLNTLANKKENSDTDRESSANA